jgi:hypothetical protein
LKISGIEKDGVPVFCAFDDMVMVGDLKPNPSNPNFHPQEQIEMLAAIIQNGWRAPITVSNRSGFIVRGHGRLLAAQHLGLKSAPVDWQDYKSEAEELADLLADNKIPELSVLDGSKALGILAQIGTAGLDIAMAAFGPGDLARLQDEQVSVSGDKEQSNGAARNYKSAGFTIKPVVVVEALEIFERAVKRTGERNRGLAVLKICEAYLEHSEKEGQPDTGLESFLAPQDVA